MNKVEHIAQLLKQASEAHHSAFEKSGGIDEDWSLWYAKWLVDNPETTNIIGKPVTESKFAYTLLALDIDYTDQKPEQNWSDYYAANFSKYLYKKVSN